MLCLFKDLNQFTLSARRLVWKLEDTMPHFNAPVHINIPLKAGILVPRVWVTVLACNLHITLSVCTTGDIRLVGGQTLLRVRWKSATTTNGAQYVMIHGELLILTWSVNSLDSLQQVASLIWSYYCRSASFDLSHFPPRRNTLLQCCLWQGIRTNPAGWCGLCCLWDNTLVLP